MRPFFLSVAYCHPNRHGADYHRAHRIVHDVVAVICLHCPARGLAWPPRMGGHFFMQCELCKDLDGQPSSTQAHGALEPDTGRWLQDRPRFEFVYRCSACGTKWTRPLAGSKIPALWTAA